MARHLGPFELLTLVGKSRQCMAWRVRDPRRADAPHDGLLLLPRLQPVDAAGARSWEQAVRRAARLKHPNLAEPREIGTCEHWPYVLYDSDGAQTLAERLREPGFGAQEAASLCLQLLRGLAFAHDGGVAHRDLQPFMLLLGEQQPARLLGLEVALQDTPQQTAPHTSMEALQLPALRDAAQRDVIAAGLLLHWMLAGRPALDEADVAALVPRLPPSGRELVRLPWGTPLPVPEALRAIANRATDRQPRQRYRSARGMERALDGWLQSEGSADDGPLALLLDRLHAAGTLPSSPGSAARAARLARMDRERTNELAEVVLQDLALSFEMLRAVNAAQVRAALATGSGPLLTVRRSIALLGLDGVRRAATGLRAWPGPLAEPAALALQAQIDSARRAARVAQALRPAGYDAEVVHLVTLLQNLGRLLVAYHFPDDLQQVRRLMQPSAVWREGEAEDAGMTEQAASYAVLGADIEGIGAAVGRHWGLDDMVLRMMRRLPLTTPPRTIDNDDDLLRAVASCANEAVDVLGLPEARREAALRRVAQRYGRALALKLEDLKDALRDTRWPADAGPAHDVALPQDSAV